MNESMNDGLLTLTKCFVFYTISYGLRSIHVLIVLLMFYWIPVKAPAKMHSQSISPLSVAADLPYIPMAPLDCKISQKQVKKPVWYAMEYAHYPHAKTKAQFKKKAPARSTCTSDKGEMFRNIQEPACLEIIARLSPHRFALIPSISLQGGGKGSRLLACRGAADL